MDGCHGDERDEAGRDEEMAAKDGCHGDTDARDDIDWLIIHACAYI